ncbi:MAG: response regulator [Promethearchaeota archaeon]|nr:MAG: response regulator [Candidatus Lokiarchaeota archaeon]
MSESKPLLIIVDDNEDILFNLKLMLEENNYEVEIANSGKKAIELLSSIKKVPDLIISDIMMPEMNGYDFFSSLSSHPQWNHIPFLFLTAKSTPEDIRLGKMLGVDDYITKPFRKEDLLASISGKITRNMKSNLIDKEIKQLLLSLNFKIGPSIFDKEHPNLCLLLVYWDDVAGPILKKSYPSDKDCTISINTIGKQLFNAATSIYGHDKITKAEGILLNIENIKKQGYVYFDSLPDKNERFGEKQYMLSVIAPFLNYFNSLKIKQVLKEISEKIKYNQEWEIKRYWEIISKILTTRSYLIKPQKDILRINP